MTAAQADQIIALLETIRFLVEVCAFAGSFACGWLSWKGFVYGKNHKDFW